MKLLSVLPIILSLTIIILAICSFFLLVYEPFKYNFGNVFSLDLILYIDLSAFVSLIFLAGLLFLKIYIKKLNYWFIATIFLIVLFSSIGSSFIFNFFGASNLFLVLRDSYENGKIVGSITCKSDYGHLLVNNKVTCDFTPKLYNFTANVSFNLNNGSSFVETQYNTISFIAPYDTKRIGFNLVGFDEKNNSRKLEVSNDFKFYTEEETIQRNDKLIAYLLGLIGIVAFSIPNMMTNFKELYSGNVKEFCYKKCARCKGSGVITDNLHHKITCPVCYGKGWNKI